MHQLRAVAVGRSLNFVEFENRSLCIILLLNGPVSLLSKLGLLIDDIHKPSGGKKI